MMIIYYDTEFTSLDGNIDWDMISAGFVAEDGREWYAEITDFDRSTCSDFVIETVLPLLEAKPEHSMRGKAFAERLLGWLKTFGEPIEFVSDARCDHWLLHAYVGDRLKELPHSATPRVWVMASDEEIQQALANAETTFWAENPGKQHHALYDARRLRLIVQTQRRLLMDC